MKAKKICIALICFVFLLGGTVLYAAQSTPKHPTKIRTSKTVSWVQIKLKHLGYYHGRITGILDRSTRESTKLFQKEHGLKVDGIPGKKTRKAIRKALKEKTLLKKSSTPQKQQPANVGK